MNTFAARGIHTTEEKEIWAQYLLLEILEHGVTNQPLTEEERGLVGLELEKVKGLYGRTK